MHHFGKPCCNHQSGCDGVRDAGLLSAGNAVCTVPPFARTAAALRFEDVVRTVMPSSRKMHLRA